LILEILIILILITIIRILGGMMIIWAKIQDLLVKKRKRREVERIQNLRRKSEKLMISNELKTNKSAKS
jgi:hypothetical protein